MNIISWESFIGGKLKSDTPLGISIGVFDGLHSGHRKLLNEITSVPGLESAVVTFTANPRIYFNDSSYPGDIQTLRQKLISLESFGVDNVVLIDFSGDFSKLSGKDFLKNVEQNCNLRKVAVGNNFRYGYNGSTSASDTAAILEKSKVEVVIGETVFYRNSIISSTRIRNAVVSGRLKEAGTMLERVFSLDFADIPHISKEETIIIERKHIKQVLPPQGQYEVFFLAAGKREYTEVSITREAVILRCSAEASPDEIYFYFD